MKSEAGKKKLSFSTLHAIAMEKAREIHDEPMEHLYSISENGFVYSETGDCETVGTPSTLSKGVIDVHNHPHINKIPSSFSGDDIRTFLEWKQKQEMIVSCYGSYFWLRRGTCVANPDEVYDAVEKGREEIDNAIFESLPANTSKKEWRMLYKRYRAQLEVEYHKYLISYTREIGLKYGKAKL